MLEVITRKGRPERLAKELNVAQDASARAADAMKTARAELIHAIAEGVDVEAARKREAIARAAAAEAAGTVEAVSEALRQVREEEAAAARAAEVAELNEKLAKSAAVRDKALREGVETVAKGFVRIGAAWMEDRVAEGLVEDLRAHGVAIPHAAALIRLAVEDQIETAIRDAYVRSNPPGDWAETFTIHLAPPWCIKA